MRGVRGSREALRWTLNQNMRPEHFGLRLTKVPGQAHSDHPVSTLVLRPRDNGLTTRIPPKPEAVPCSFRRMKAVMITGRPRVNRPLEASAPAFGREYFSSCPWVPGLDPARRRAGRVDRPDRGPQSGQPGSIQPRGGLFRLRRCRPVRLPASTPDARTFPPCTRSLPPNMPNGAPHLKTLLGS
jgi:hypothetical protein